MFSPLLKYAQQKGKRDRDHRILTDPQRDHRVHLSGPPRWEIARQQRDRSE
jgi:hypothetical protein